MNINEQARKEFISQYVPGSIWYNRDILGQRSIAEGLIYKTLAGEFSLPAGQKKPHSITLDEAKAMQFGKIIVGVDFGGNGSGHAFIARTCVHCYGNIERLPTALLTAVKTVRGG